MQRSDNYLDLLPAGVREKAGRYYEIATVNENERLRQEEIARTVAEYGQISKAVAREMTAASKRGHHETARQLWRQWREISAGHPYQTSIHQHSPNAHPDLKRATNARAAGIRNVAYKIAKGKIGKPRPKYGRKHYTRGG